MQKLLYSLFIFSLLASMPVYGQKQFRALLFTKTEGFHHESINAGVTAIKELAVRNFFDVDWHENPAVFNPEALKRYDVVIFLSTTGNILNADQQKAFEDFIRSGKGFVGIHSASDTEYEWEWYTRMVGRMFHIHPAIQTARLSVVDSNFPGMEGMPAKKWWTDEWYEFGEEKTKGLNYLITVDESTFKPEASWGPKSGKGMGDFHPIAWYHHYDGGRAYYNALGHIPETFSDAIFRDQIYGGIYWAATGKGIEKK